MTLLEMSVVYAEHAAVIRSRIVELRGLTRQETDPEAVQALKRRVAALLPLWQEARDLARLTAHYYDYVWTPRAVNFWQIWPTGSGKAPRITLRTWSGCAGICAVPASRCSRSGSSRCWSFTTIRDSPWGRSPPSSI